MPIQGTITLNHLYTTSNKAQAMPPTDDEGDVLPECYADQENASSTRH